MRLKQKLQLDLIDSTFPEKIYFQDRKNIDTNALKDCRVVLSTFESFGLQSLPVPTLTPFRFLYILPDKKAQIILNNPIGDREVQVLRLFNDPAQTTGTFKLTWNSVASNDIDFSSATLDADIKNEIENVLLMGTVDVRRRVSQDEASNHWDWVLEFTDHSSADNIDLIAFQDYALNDIVGNSVSESILRESEEGHKNYLTITNEFPTILRGEFDAVWLRTIVADTTISYVVAN